MDDFEEILKAVLETEVDEEADLEDWIKKQKLSDKGVKAVKAALRMLSAYKDELPKDVLSKLASVAGYPAPKKAKEKEEEEDKYPSPKKKAKAKEEEEEDDKMKKVKKGLDVPKEVQEHFDTVIKAQNDRFDALKEQNEKVEKALKAEKDERELQDWITKAENDLSHLPGKTSEELAKDLKKMSDFDPEMAKKQFEQMKSASETIAKSEMFQELGGSGQGVGGSAWDKIVKAAQGLVEKSGAELSEAQAIDRVLTTSTGQELYSEYLKEHPAQT